jgi:hypothetical protein
MRKSYEDRIKSAVKVSKAGCWIWQKGKGSGSKTHRYGRMAYYGEPINAHRASWLIFRGPISDGMYVCHKCDNTLCVNPDHLFIGSNADNLRDMAEKGRAFNGQRAKTHCPKGHEYTLGNVYVGSHGERQCRECRKYSADRDRERNRLKVAAWRAANREKALASYARANAKRKQRS